MTEKAKNFIYLLEKGKAPTQDGYSYFESGFFDNPSWYRYNNRIYQWQITFDLVKWYNVSDINIQLNIDNLFIVNYLKIKEIKNNIVIMTKNYEDLVNTLCNNIYINLNDFENIYNDNIISEIIQNINEINNSVNKVKNQINELELDYQLRANKKNVEVLKRELIYHNQQYQYLKEDYYKRLINLKSNCIRNTDMFLTMYNETTDAFELLKSDFSLLENKYNQKCNEYNNLNVANKKLNDELKNGNNYNIEQSMKVTVLEIEIKEKNDIIKNFKNEMNKKPNDIIAIQHLETKIFSLNFDNKNYLNKINNLESKINCFSEDTTNYKNKIDNLENKIKFYEDEEKHFSSSNEISKVKINQLELKVFNLERSNEKLQMYSQNCICLSVNNESNILQKEMTELREKLCIETANKIKIINDAQLLLNTKYTWNNDRQIFEENDFELLE